MKNIAVASSILMLLGSAIAKPMAHNHHHHRRNIRYVYKTETCTKTVYYTSTKWVSYETETPEAAPEAAPVQPPAAVYTPPVASPHENHDTPALVQAPPPPPPPPATPTYKATPADAAAAANQAAIESQNAKIKAQEAANRAQESINAAQDRYNQDYQNGSHPPPPKPKYTPPPQEQTPPPPSGGGGGQAGGKSPIAGIKYSGQGTFYTPGVGACGFTSGEDELVCAISRKIYEAHTIGGNPNNNSLCNTYVRASANGKSVRLKVVDNCFGCNGDSDVDMTEKAFKMLANPDQGRIDITWEACE